MKCLYGADTADGCCHKAETLLLWNNRPSYSTTQSYVSGFGGAAKHTCFTSSQAEMEAVQSIYHYYNTFNITLFPDVTGPRYFVDLPYGPEEFSIGGGCANPICDQEYLSNPGNCTPASNDVCCSLTVDTNDCVYDAFWGGVSNPVGGLSNWRRKTLYDDETSRWFIEMIGYNGDINYQLGGGESIGSLQSTFKFMLHNERWWKMPDDCATDAALYAPGAANAEVASDLVPEYWMYACTGIPIYEWEIEDALATGVINGDEYSDIMTAIAIPEVPPQAAIRRFAKFYGEGNDWRKDQQQIYQDLHARFPTAGYDAFFQACSAMPLLAPFRKRCTNLFSAITNAASAVPLLHKDDVITELSSKQAQWIAYPGSLTNEEDYNFWRERQWVYFSGKPAGWAWGDWATSEEDLINGMGRNGGTGGTLLEGPLKAFMGLPRPDATCVSCAATAACTTFPLNKPFCSECTGSCPDVTPLGACNPSNLCRRFIVAPKCEGIHFVFHQYIYENVLAIDCLSTTGEHRCFYTVHSYLTAAKRDESGWTTQCPYACLSGPLAVAHTWDSIVMATPGLSAICDGITADVPYHVAGDNCCGAYCDDATQTLVCTEVIEEIEVSQYFPCPFIGHSNPCASADDCPPHNNTTPDQLGCIGFTPDCTESP